jgi:undecaprenyl-diphosphatase
MPPIDWFDFYLFGLINGLAGWWPWLDGLARLLLNDYFTPTLLAIGLLSLWFEPDNNLADFKDLSGATPNQQAVLAACLSAGLANLALKIINWLYFRPRPFADHPVNLLFYHPTDSSFPSNAATLGFAIAAGVWFYNRSWGRMFLLLAALFGLSRIFGGVHYPSDVIAGAALGWLAAGVIYRQHSRLNRLLTWIVPLARRLNLT